MPDNYWWNPKPILSYNALFNFIVGAMGCGKTHGLKTWFIKQFLQDGGQFIYIRRTDKELEKSAKKFTNDLGFEFPDHMFRKMGDELHVVEINHETGEPKEGCKWRVCGYFAYLTGARIQKSTSYHFVKNILFDEFIIPKGSVRGYMEDEVEAFLEMYESIARMRDVRCFFCANALTMINPYFLYFNITQKPTSKNGIMRVKKDLVFELCRTEAYREAKKETRFGQLVKGTDFEKYAIENDFVWDTTGHIEKKTGNCFYEFSLQIGNEWVAVYRNNMLGKVWISEDVDLNRPLKYGVKLNDKFNTMVFKNRRQYVKIDDLFTNFQMGNVYFETQKCKTLVWDMFTKLL